MLSRVSSYDWLVSLVFQPIAYSPAGPAAETFGRAETLWAAAVLSGATWLVVLALPSARGMRRA